MADQTPDPTAWSDDQLDDLLDALAQRAAERDDLDLPASGVSRRGVLATLLGAGGLGIGASQLGAAASWNSASGTVGTQSSPIDQANVRDLDAKLIEAEQVLESAGAVIKTWTQSGSDPDQRLDNALSAASNGDKLFLETSTFNADRTISKNVEFVGSGGSFNGAEIDNCTWTFNSRVSARNLNLTNSVTVNIDSIGCILSQCELFATTSIAVSGDKFRFVNNEGGSVTFESGTTSGIVDGCTSTSVTDNGTNLVADVS